MMEWLVFIGVLVLVWVVVVSMSGGA